MNNINILRSDEHHGYTEYRGEFKTCKGWTFVADVEDEPAKGNDCWICGKDSRVTRLAFFRDGQAGYVCPDSDYDGDRLPVSKEMEAMAKDLANYFSS